MVTILLFEVNYKCNTGASPLALGKSILYILISDKRALVLQFLVNQSYSQMP